MNEAILHVVSTQSLLYYLALFKNIKCCRKRPHDSLPVPCFFLAVEFCRVKCALHSAFSINKWPLPDQYFLGLISKFAMLCIYLIEEYVSVDRASICKPKSLLHNSLGSKAAPRPGGIGSAAAGQPGVDGESMLSKMLPGGAAEQAGKLGEGEQRVFKV